jgi:hypothetical protein
MRGLSSLNGNDLTPGQTEAVLVFLEAITEVEIAERQAHKAQQRLRFASRWADDETEADRKSELRKAAIKLMRAQNQAAVTAAEVEAVTSMPLDTAVGLLVKANPRLKP